MLFIYYVFSWILVSDNYTLVIGVKGAEPFGLNKENISEIVPHSGDGLKAMSKREIVTVGYDQVFSLSLIHI